MDLLKYTLRFAEDPNSGKANESWVKLLPMGETIEYHGRTIELSQDYLRTLLAETRRLNAYFDEKASGTAYRQPVWREHTPRTERDGDVLDVKLADKQDFNGVWVKLARTDETEEAIKAGKIKFVSAGIVPEYQVESGETFGPVIREVSLTGDPFLKSIGAIQDTLGVQLSQDALTELENLKEEDMDKLLEAIEKLTQKIDEQGEAIRALKDRMKDDDSEPTDDRTEPEDDTTPEGDDSTEADDTTEVDASEDDDTTEPDVPKTPEVDDASTEGDDQPVTMSQLKSFFNEKFGKSNLNLSEQGHQGSPEVPAADRDSRYQELRRQGYSPTEAAKKANQ
jgi:Sec-independent protein translocase protein TatA